MSVFVVDIDGCICNEDVDVSERTGFQARISKLNQLYEDGHYIIYFTARGMKSQHNDQMKADTKYRFMTEQQLSKWGCKYHELYFGKPNADYYIDNKNIDMDDFFGESSVSDRKI